MTAHVPRTPGDRRRALRLPVARPVHDPSSEIVVVFVLGVIVGVAVCLLLSAASASAQAHHGADVEAVAAAQVCAHERGWRHSSDCAGYVEVIHRVQHARRRRTFVEAAHLYAANAFNPEAPRNRWAADLAADGHEPRSWPATLPWHAYRPRWYSLIDYAWSLMHGKDWIPCGELAEHWAACTHATSPLFRLLVCPGAADCFYARR